MPRSTRFGMATIALAILLAACSQATVTPAPTDAVAPTVTPAPTDAVAPTPTPPPTATRTPGPPSAPTNFAVADLPDPVACPVAVPTDVSSMCGEIDFTWESSEGPDAWFRIYLGSTGEGDLTCQDIDVSNQYQEFTTSAPGARSVHWYYNGRATGGGTSCYWLAAVNLHGSSALVPASGQA